ncbi:MAG: zinc-ribbon domain containing protein [Patescibacteria group bacterium]
MQNKKCKNCDKEFSITDGDIAYYNEIKVPAPTFCPDCRQQRRLVWRNERNLYKRKCSATGAEIISVYSPDKPFPVYENNYWFSPQWDALKYGRDFDFNRPFFEQFEELMNAVPQLARSAVGNQNCDYTNQCGWCKNCYLIFEADFNENCYYSNNIYDSKQTMDCLMVIKCELCYECINCENCYGLKYSQNCVNCADSWFLKNCIGCRNCFGCVNLRNKEYYFLNEKCSKDDYFQKIANTNLNTNLELETARKNFAEFCKKFPHKYMEGIQNEDSTGDYLSHTQRCLDCFDVNNSQDCKYVFNSRMMKKCYDITVFGSIKWSEYCHENHEVGYGVRNVHFSDQVWTDCYDILYSKECINGSHNLFGCVGLQHGNYAILNKKYSKEEYEKFVPKIIEHMKQTGQFGEFFPGQMAYYGYNETIAQDYFPLSKEQALAEGYKWKDSDEKEYKTQTYKIPERIKDVPDDILTQVLACVTCGKNYKIVEEELKFYHRMNLPIPVKCHDCRHKIRFNMRNKRHLYKRTCQKCGTEIETTYSPQRPEIVYCEKCYVQSTD